MKYTLVSPKKVYIETVIGACNRRLLDAQKLSSFFENNGCQILASPQNADILVLFTCAVSIKRENLSINRVYDLKKFNGELVVCGCLPVINEKRLAAVHDGVKIPTSELLNIDDYFPDMTFKYSMLEDSNTYFPLYRKVFSKAFLRAIKFQLEIVRTLSFKYVTTKLIPKLVKNILNGKKEEVKPYPIRLSWGCNRHCSYCM